MLTLIAVVLTTGIAMAKPPEPLEEIFPATTLIVDASVVEVVSEDPPLADGSHDVQKQTVVLQLNRVVRGKLPADAKLMKSEGLARLTVTKPKAPYKLKAGVKGPWLLATDAKTGEHTILGRYGPDSWTFEKIDAKLKELDPPQLR